MGKRVLTQVDLEENPQLQLDGYKAGDTYDDGVPEAEGTDQEIKESTENANTEAAAAADDTGGGAPPPDKPRDDN